LALSSSYNNSQLFVCERIEHCIATNLVCFRARTSVLAAFLVNALKDCSLKKTFIKVLRQARYTNIYANENAAVEKHEMVCVYQIPGK